MLILQNEIFGRQIRRLICQKKNKKIHFPKMLCALYQNVFFFILGGLMHAFNFFLENESRGFGK